MKQFILIITLLLSAVKIQAQECIVLYPPGVPTVPNSSYGDPTILENYAPAFVRTLYIAAHIVRSSSGSGGISTANLNTAIEQLNTAYQQAFIRFELSETDYIDNSQYTNLTREVFIQLAQINVKPNKLNIYFVPSSSTLNGIAYLQNNRCAVTNAASINTSTLPHEVGHNLYLYHTHSDAVNPPTDCTPVRPLELVNGSNCEFAGDFLCDTPAEPFNCGSGLLGYVNSTNCTYTGTFRDPNNQLYNPDVYNFMGYSTANCRNDFTQLQVSRMHYTLISSLSYLISESVVLTNKVSGNNIPNTVDKPSMLTVGSDSPVSSGTSVNLLDGYIYQIKTNQERFPSYLTYGNIKHNNWNNESAQFKLNEYYPIDRSVNTDLYRDANFLPFKYSKIEVKLEGLTISNICAFQFKDPWYVKSDGSQPGDFWIPCTSIYEPNGKDGATEKGVFLNQNPDPNNPNKPYYSVKAEVYQDADLGGNIGVRRFYFQNWNGTDATLENPNDLETGVVFTNENAVVQSNYKGRGISNDQNAYSSGSQRRLVRLYDGKLFSCYTSSNKLWLELSADNGQNWLLWPGHLPYDVSSDEWECTPSIDWIPWTMAKSFAALVNITPNSELKVRIIRHSSIDPHYTKFLYPIWGLNVTPPLTPVVGVSSNNIMIVGNGGSTASQEGLYYFYGAISYNGSVSVSWVDENTPRIIPGTTQYSKNPTISANKNSNTFHIAWEEGNSIKYIKATVSGNNITFSSVVTPSNGCGYTYNYSPSILVMETDDLARLCWVGKRTVSDEEGENSSQGMVTFQSKVLFKGLGNLSRNWAFGNNVSSPNINKKDNNSSNPYYAFGWYESQGQSKFADNTLSTVRTLNTVGQQVQISNGSDKDNMFAMTFNNSSLPYYFQTSNNLGSFYSLGKTQNNVLTTGREGIVSIDSAEFYFALGDILINDQPIDFVEISDTTQVNGLSLVNEYLISEPVNVTDNCSFFYSVQYGINDSLNAAITLTDNRFVNFKVQLVDDNTDVIIGEYNNITYSAGNISKYNNIQYQVNTGGIGTRTIRLKLLLTNNFSADYSLAKIFADESVLGKAKIKQINFTGSEIPITYDLAQNYPNPFNPGTTIRYQIPQDGIVTLKIYDILGSEVATLVNEEKVAGKYEVTFSATGGASQLASGVYIYKIQSGSFINSKKMMLLK